MRCESRGDHMDEVLCLPAARGDECGRHAKLHVVTCVMNPIRYQSRWRLYRDFARHVEDAGAELWTVEAAFGNRPFEITDASHPRHIRVRTSHEFWLKENLLNLGFSRLPQDWEYAAWIDADVHFVRPDWVSETIHQLQHYSVVQMFSEAVDLSPEYGIINWFRSFGRSYLDGRKYGDWKNGYGQYWHPGFAWAIRREAFDHLGGLIDFAMGSGDHHMAMCLIGLGDRSVPKGMTDSYRKKILTWQERAERYILRKLGCVDGLLCHNWHGAKKNRKYIERWKILTSNKYDPDVDLKRDWQGVWQLTDNNITLRDQIKQYLRARDEDSREAPRAERILVDYSRA